MTIILSAFGDTLRSKPMEVPDHTDRWHMAYLPSTHDWLLGFPVSANTLTFTWRGKVEYRDGGRWPSEGIRILELEDR